MCHRRGRALPAAIQVDTGMSRLGFHLDELRKEERYWTGAPPATPALPERNGFIERNDNLPLEVVTVGAEPKEHAVGSFGFSKSDTSKRAIDDALAANLRITRAPFHDQ